MKRDRQMVRDWSVHEESEGFPPASVPWENVCTLDDSEQQTTFSFALSHKTLSGGGTWCSLSGHSRSRSAGGGGLPVRDFHSRCPPKRASHLPSLLRQVCGVENPSKVNLKELYGASTQQGGCWCAAEEGDCGGSLAVPTSLGRMFNFQAHWYTHQQGVSTLQEVCWKINYVCLLCFWLLHNHEIHEISLDLIHDNK